MANSIFQTSRTASLRTDSIHSEDEKHSKKLKCFKCAQVRTFSDANCRLRHEREIHKMHGGPKELFCQYVNCKNREERPFKRPEYLAAHERATHKGQHSDSHNAVKQGGTMPITTAPGLNSIEEPQRRTHKRSELESGCQVPMGETIEAQIEAVRAESSSIRTMFVSQSVEMQSLKTQLSQIRTQANDCFTGNWTNKA